MKASRAIEILIRQRDEIESIRVDNSSSPAFTKWQRDTEVAIQKIFGDKSRHFKDFSDISYSLFYYTDDTTDSDFFRAYIDGLSKARAILSSLIDEIKDYELEDEEDISAPDILSLLERICLKFHTVARQLRARHSGRKTLEIEDEYDVQDLLHALLKLHFDDIRPEEWTPSYAGGSSRVDFLLKQERVIIEVKKTRQSLKTPDLGAELLVDIARYQRHPDCGLLVCFIYDPEGRVGNPVGLEKDLEAHNGTLKVRAIVGPKF
ncbi:hypothetical protein [Undibacterium pigrum]|uniref:Uncharacterized protein n=1 Tax=Undibacterium pigrum TaxID=401470 RepID=A0A318J783_9BURK|nr:hypothetical protein [Undibacterium pigrum]PXX42520.1 hypothetical protein DFR42_105178 [Undibacterium pigrum]